MEIVCFDMEGTLTPEIWERVALRTGIDEFNKTTRDIPDYSELMDFRLDVMRSNKLKLSDIQEASSELELLPGAYNFLQKIRQNFQVVILSDTFHEIAKPLMEKMGFPLLLCHNLDVVNDEIISYNYLIDQNITTKALFFQSDWSLSDEISLLSGIRIDKHSLLENIVASPRLSLLYNLRANSQFRISYSSGFRAPQAFDTDLHIAFAGGGISRISLADDLREEISNSFSGSYNYDFARERYVYGITLQGFYTYLDKAFYQDLNGSDEFGDLYVKRNGSGALVKGLSFEIRGNYNKIIQLETGYTLQSSKYDSPVLYSDELAPKDDFLRTPSFYGYSTLSLNFNKKLDIYLNHIYTGQMDLIHMGGAINQAFDEYITSKVFNQYDVNVNYKQFFNNVGVGVKCSVGIKNITNSYQNDFDIMKDRDSNFIYGPSVPRMILFGVSLFSI